MIWCPLSPVLATDCDSGSNAELTYYTLSPDFSISPHGTIFPASRLDYERPNHLYEFVVMATDGGIEPHSGTATVRMRMANINDEAPEFSQPVWVPLLRTLQLWWLLLLLAKVRDIYKCINDISYLRKNIKVHNIYYCFFFFSVCLCCFGHINTFHPLAAATAHLQCDYSKNL